MKIRLFILFLVTTILMIVGINLTRNERFSSLSLKYGLGVQDFTKTITANYILFRTSAHEIFIAPNDGYNNEIAIIPSKVIKLNDYKEFIIAERQGMKKRSPDDSLDTYEIPDVIVKDYWILNTKKNYVLKKLEF